MGYTALGADIFTGLFTQGIKEAGYEVLAHLEHAPYGVASAKLYFPDLDIRIGKANWGLEDFKGKVDFMYTNPPCAAWSTMRNSEGDGDWRLQTARLGYIRDMVGAGLTVEPKAWCWESVCGAWTRGNEFVLEQARRWTRSGWSATVLLVDAQRFKVPQRRHRMFLVAHKHPLVFPPMYPSVTVQEALTGVPGIEAEAPVYPKPLTRYWKRLWEGAPTFNGHLASVFDDITKAELAEYKAESGGSGCYKPLGATLRLKPDRAGPVMLSGATRYHPFEPRQLSWYEWLALCGLPKDWKTSCHRYEPATVELARGVMPGVGKWLGTAVMGGLSLPELGEPTIRHVDLRNEGREIDQLLWEPKMAYTDRTNETQEQMVTRVSTRIAEEIGQAFIEAFEKVGWITPEGEEPDVLRKLCF